MHKPPFKQGSPQGAIESMKRAVAKDTKFTRGWIMLGTLQIGMSDNDGGVASLRRAVESDPQNPLCYKVLAFSLTSIKRRRDAIQTWHELEKVSPVIAIYRQT
jgi:cytochrome c-type biogenesis protein CcmH/NrfG